MTLTAGHHRLNQYTLDGVKVVVNLGILAAKLSQD